MPKVDIQLLDEASMKAFGFILPLWPGQAGTGVAKRDAFLKAAGISKGQWKRAWLASKRALGLHLSVSELALKKLKVMAEHGQNPHLTTLLKVVEAQGCCDDVE